MDLIGRSLDQRMRRSFPSSFFAQQNFFIENVSGEIDCIFVHDDENDAFVVIFI